MENRLRALSLAFMLVFVPLARVVHAQRQSNDVEKTARVRSEIAKRVTNKKTRVKIKLRNGVELKGHIDQADDSRFTITEEKTGKRIEMAYSEVDGVKGQGLGKGAKIGIIAAVGSAVVVIAAAVSLRNFDPFKRGVLR